jgi:hypothetical protein
MSLDSGVVYSRRNIKFFKQANKEYTGWMKTDGVSLWENGMKTQSRGRKRKRGRIGL